MNFLETEVEISILAHVTIQRIVKNPYSRNVVHGVLGNLIRRGYTDSDSGTVDVEVRAAAADHEGERVIRRGNRWFRLTPTAYGRAVAAERLAEMGEQDSF